MLRRIVLLLSMLVALVLVAAVAALVFIDPDDYRDEIAQRASDQLGREVRLEGPLELKLFPRLAIALNQTRIGNPPGFENLPLLADVGTATASVRLWPLIRGELDIGTIVVEDARLSFLSDADGRTNLEGLFAAERPDDRPAPEPDLSDLRTGPVRLRNVAVSMVDVASGDRTELVIDRLDLDPFAPDRAVSFSIRARLDSDGEVVISSLEMSGDLELARNASRLSLSDLVTRFELPDGTVTGRADADLVAHLGRTDIEVELTRLDARFDLPGLSAALRTTETARLVLADPATLALPGAELQIDDDHLNLAGDLSLGEPIRGRLDVTGERLDLRWLAALDGADGREAGRDGDADFEPLKRLDLRLSLKLDRLILVEGIVLQQVEAESRLADGVLQLDPMRAMLFSGNFDGRAEVDFNHDPPRARVSPRLSGVLVEELAGLFSDHVPVTGSGDLSLDLAFQGMTPADILATLDGDGQLSISDGAVQGVDLQRLIEQELTAAALGDIRQVFSGSTPFRQLSGSLRAQQGVIELPNLELAAGDYAARGSGRIDFAGDQVDYQLEIDLGETLAARLPDSLRRATGGRIPLSISGSVAEPVVAVDLASLVERTARDEIGRRLLERLERPRRRDEPEEEHDGDEEGPPPRL